MAADKSRDIIAEAVADAKAVKDLHVKAAVNQLVERMTPQVRQLVERTLRRPNAESVDRMNRARDGYGETEFEENLDRGDVKMTEKKDDKDMEHTLEAMFPALSEMGEPDMEEPVPEAAEIPTLGEKKDDEEMDEEIEISEAELAKAFEQAQVAEAMVTKGFKDMTPNGELDDAAKETGIADKKSGEAHWHEKGALPPDKKDWTIKEMIQAGIAENKKLREQRDYAVKVAKYCAAKLHEVNLFNSKVLHVNRMFTRHGRLTKEQKKTVLESLDRASSIDEVQKIYSTLDEAFRVAGVVTESRAARPRADAARARKTGGVVISESGGSRPAADGGANSKYSRLHELAGIVNRNGK